MTAGALHVVVPLGIDDPSRTSGGNTYDRRVCAALRDLGWEIDLVEVEGGWPWTAELGAGDLEHALRSLPDGAHVLVDGLLASRLPRVMLPASRRLRIILLVHLPVGVDDARARLPERQVVAAAASVITPSAWCRDWLVAEYGLDPGRVRVAHPGVEPARPASRTASSSALLSVGSLAPVKGQDRLLGALADVRDLPWTWTCVGSTSVAPDFARDLQRSVTELGLADRVVLAGPLTGRDLDEAYDAADVLVLPSRAETYGMVVTEALARGLPVIATDVGGVGEALGETRDGGRAGILVRTGDGLSAALRRWLTDATTRDALRSAALDRRSRLEGWSVTAQRVADVVRQVAA